MRESVEKVLEGAAGNLVLADEEIVARVLEGDVASFELIMRRYNQRLYRVVRGILGDDDEAEDVLQETYVRAIEHLRQFAGAAKFSTWLTKIAVHESLARRRERERMQPTDLDVADPRTVLRLAEYGRAERAASSAELGQLLARAVDALPDPLRSVFTLRVIDGLDTSEAATCLEISEANVKVRLHRARTMLQSFIDREIGQEARQLYEFGGDRCDRLVRAVLSRIVPS